MSNAGEMARENQALPQRLSRLSQASLRISESLDFDNVLQGSWTAPGRWPAPATGSSPIEGTERRIRMTADYIDDTERLAGV